jgi:hypothetical protein
MDWHQQNGSGLTKGAQVIYGAGAGTIVGLVGAVVLVSSANGFKPLLIVIIGGLLGAIITYLAIGILQSGNAINHSRGKSQAVVQTNSVCVRDYPRWIVRLFYISLMALMIGVLSTFYIALAGFSIFALAGTYLIPLGMIALNYILGIAERCAAK